MGRIVGIDLGTTYSAVAIPEERAGEGFFVSRECPGYSIILDKLKRRITPSVVAEDERGQIVVGHSAKGRAGLSPEPVMFSKRWMGEDKTFQLAKQGALKPEDVAARVLGHLKQLAEERLGEAVEEAVITVPAYFSLRAKQMTEKAGEQAGLHVAQIAQEPVAAALMYCANDPRDPLRIMTYDLGGGTFDVAILEKRDGTISTDSIRSFDGNRFLGGYNFDNTLAQWILGQLNSQGYSLQLDPNNQADNVVFAKLMIYAERAKIALSKQDAYELQDPETGIKDHAGNPVAIELAIMREQFEHMIVKEVEETIELCRRAMSKAKPAIRHDQIDEILMVGGSSRIPMIGRRLEKEFGRMPRLVEPDLCVALGAAILAGTKPKTFGCLKLDTIPERTDMPNLTVTGRVMPTGDLRAVEGCAVTLYATDGGYGPVSRTVGAEGAFVFQSVPVPPESRTDFVLSVTSPARAEIAAHRFSVTHTDAGVGGGLVEGNIGTNVLSKPISILLLDGLNVIAPERTPLPYDVVVLTETSDTSGEIHVPIYEENNPLGEILMKEIPRTLPVGSSVEITLSLQENYQIRGRAFVTALAREATVVIDIPVRAQKSIQELRRDYEMLRAQAEDSLNSAGAGVKFGDGKAMRLKDQLENTKEMLNNPRPEPAAIQDRLDEIENLTREVGAGWKAEPPRAVFQHKASEAEDLIAQAISKKPEVAQDGYDRQLAAIRAEAEKAYSDQNSAAWKDSFDKVVSLCDRLESLTRRDGPSSPPPDPSLIILELAKELLALQKWAEERGRYKEFEGEFKALAEALKRIDPRAGDAMTQIRDWYLTRFSDLQQRLNAPETKGILKKVQPGS